MNNTFVLAVTLGIVIGSVNAYFKWKDGYARPDILKTLLGWFVAFFVTGLIASSIARMILIHVL